MCNLYSIYIQYCPITEVSLMKVLTGRSKKFINSLLLAHVREKECLLGTGFSQDRWNMKLVFKIYIHITYIHAFIRRERQGNYKLAKSNFTEGINNNMKTFIIKHLVV